MGISIRHFVVPADDTVLRLEGMSWWRLLYGEPGCRLPDLAGQRVRMAEAVVELDGRAPRRLLRCTFLMPSFDEAGHLDKARLRREQSARAENTLGLPAGPATGSRGVVDAVSRFVAQGGSWRPSDRLMQEIESAALGHTTCRRLRAPRG